MFEQSWFTERKRRRRRERGERGGEEEEQEEKGEEEKEERVEKEVYVLQVNLTVCKHISIYYTELNFLYFAEEKY